MEPTTDPVMGDERAGGSVAGRQEVEKEEAANRGSMTGSGTAGRESSGWWWWWWWFTEGKVIERASVSFWGEPDFRKRVKSG